MDIQQIGVVGAGLMGSGIAEVCAVSGCHVSVVDVSDEAVEGGETRLLRSLGAAVDRGKVKADEGKAAEGRVTFSTDFDTLAGSDLIVEAVVEDRTVKRNLFRRLGELVPSPLGILASNTSSIPITDLAGVTDHPGRVIGLHFFNPVPIMKLVEVIPALQTADATFERVMAFAVDRLGKTAIRGPDRGGFVVNALLVPYLLGAIRLFEGGHATRDDIDAGMRLGAGHPMGPLALCDLIGNDTLLLIADSLHDEYRDEASIAPPLLRRMVAGGLTGRKSGQGFYEY